VTAPDPKAVDDEQSFLDFVRRFSEYRAATSSSAFWQNVDVGQYLAGAYSWAEDTDFGRTQGLLESNVWQRVAVFLYVGAMYE
jgi:hypothetical protein